MIKFKPEEMIPNHGQEVYDKVSQITGLKFKLQIKDSGIEFRKIFEMKNMITGEQSYLLFTNSESIWFANKSDFIQKFIMWIKGSIDQLNSEYKGLLEREDAAIVDDNLIYFENERIGHLGNKQLKLLNKMREFRTDSPIQDNKNGG